MTAALIRRYRIEVIGPDGETEVIFREGTVDDVKQQLKSDGVQVTSVSLVSPVRPTALARMPQPASGPLKSPSQPKSPRNFFIVMGIGALFLLLMAVGSSGIDPKADEAWRLAEEAVKSCLLSPKTAVFDDMKVFAKENGSYIVTGEVTSQNLFSAMLTHRFNVAIGESVVADKKELVVGEVELVDGLLGITKQTFDAAVAERARNSAIRK